MLLIGAMPPEPSECLAVVHQLLRPSDLADLTRLAGQLLVVDKRRQQRSLQPLHTLALAGQTAPQTLHPGCLVADHQAP